MSENKSIVHELVPEHEIMSKEEGEKILAQYKVSRLQIPRIRAKDPALAGLGAKAGGIAKITRKDGSFNYRLIV